VGVTLDAVDALGEFLNDAETELIVLNPRKEVRSVPVPQTAPGRYATEFETAMGGEYWLQLTQKSRGLAVLQQTRGLAVGYPEELRLLPTDEGLLRVLAAESGGRFRPDPELALAPTEATAPRVLALWPHLALLAAVLLVGDVALRRMEFATILGWIRSHGFARIRPVKG
jgi:hypothetical protein